MTHAEEEAFRKAKLEQYNQMRHGLYQQIVSWSHSLVKQAAVYTIPKIEY